MSKCANARVLTQTLLITRALNPPHFPPAFDAVRADEPPGDNGQDQFAMGVLPPTFVPIRATADEVLVPESNLAWPPAFQSERAGDMTPEGSTFDWPPAFQAERADDLILSTGVTPESTLTWPPAFQAERAEDPANPSQDPDSGDEVIRTSDEEEANERKYFLCYSAAIITVIHSTDPKAHHQNSKVWEKKGKDRANNVIDLTNSPDGSPGPDQDSGIEDALMRDIINELKDLAEFNARQIGDTILKHAMVPSDPDHRAGNARCMFYLRGVLKALYTMMHDDMVLGGRLFKAARQISYVTNDNERDEIIDDEDMIMRKPWGPPVAGGRRDPTEVQEDEGEYLNTSPPPSSNMAPKTSKDQPKWKDPWTSDGSDQEMPAMSDGAQRDGGTAPIPDDFFPPTFQAIRGEIPALGSAGPSSITPADLPPPFEAMRAEDSLPAVKLEATSPKIDRRVENMETGEMEVDVIDLTINDTTTQPAPAPAHPGGPLFTIEDDRMRALLQELEYLMEFNTRQIGSVLHRHLADFSNDSALFRAKYMHYLRGVVKYLYEITRDDFVSGGPHVSYARKIQFNVPALPEDCIILALLTLNYQKMSDFL
ncbi:hypothetical protein BDN72DRAFT_864789 [Pluteus cervinus]|uniref:Uncharacterized protein n=1 Tax=Pluteus cervinus TaxID=181527 RepID=A0ACD3A2H7_9AGAR|nr:hypothetical protein BDN72DRAFT_864789 [Pluteus cervinus]